MTNLKRKIVSLSIVVLFAFAATIGATFAWFTIGTAATVDDINLTITTSESLLILADEGYSLPASNATLLNPASYSSSLTNQDIIDAGYNFTQIRLQPLTTLNGSTMTFRNESIIGVSSTPSATLSETGNYIMFSVWVMSQSVNANIAIGDFQAVGTNLITFKDRVEDTVRLSITNDSTTYIYGNDKDLDFAFVQGDIGFTNSASDSLLSTVKEDIEDLYGEYYKLGATTVPGEVNSNKALATQIAVLTANIPTKLTLRIWIEGWDADADNNLNGAVFDLAFQFIVKNTF